jgi:hypothetical protein
MSVRAASSDKILDPVSAIGDICVRKTVLPVGADGCGMLGGLTPQPVRSALAHFREDFGHSREDV